MFATHYFFIRRKYNSVLQKYNKKAGELFSFPNIKIQNKIKERSEKASKMFVFEDDVIKYLRFFLHNSSEFIPAGSTFFSTYLPTTQHINELSTRKICTTFFFH